LDWIWGIGGTGFCVLDGRGEVVEEGTLSNDREALSELSHRYQGALVLMEAGCHSL